MATDTPVSCDCVGLEIRELIRYATCDVTVTHDESAVGLAEGN